ncbi:hypothetical protein [Streptomyces sp. TE5632]
MTRVATGPSALTVHDDFPDPRQTARGKVLLHFTMSLDGFLAGPGHTGDRMTGFSSRPGVVEEYAKTTGAVPGGRDGRGSHPDTGALHGGAWRGPVSALTHHTRRTGGPPGV